MGFVLLRAIWMENTGMCLSLATLWADRNKKVGA